jgi:hypothetical protein
VAPEPEKGAVAHRRLTPFDEVVARFARPVAIARVAPAEALGAIVAEDARAARAVPESGLALGGGYAISSEAARGAGPSSPVPLAAVPPLVRTGDRLPLGADAVLAADAIERHGPFLAAIEEPAPGQDVLPAGADLARGAVVARRGARLTPLLVAALEAAGVATLAVARPAVAVDGPAELAALLSGALARRGIGVDGSAPLRIVIGARAAEENEVAGVALSGAEEVAVGAREGRVVILCPPTTPALLAVALALVPRLVGVPVTEETTRLSAKIASRVGVSEIALLGFGPDGAVPLTVGPPTLGATLAADHVLLCAPGSEGFPAGATITAERLP